MSQLQQGEAGERFHTPQPSQDSLCSLATSLRPAVIRFMIVSWGFSCRFLTTAPRGTSSRSQQTVIYTYVCVYIYIYTHMYMHMYVCIRVYIYIYIYIYVFVCCRTLPSTTAEPLPNTPGTPNAAPNSSFVSFVLLLVLVLLLLLILSLLLLLLLLLLSLSLLLRTRRARRTQRRTRVQPNTHSAEHAFR